MDFQDRIEILKSGVLSKNSKIQTNFEFKSNNTIQHIPHEYKLALVYASQSFHQMPNALQCI